MRKGETIPLKGETTTHKPETNLLKGETKLLKTETGCHGVLGILPPDVRGVEKGYYKAYRGESCNIILIDIFFVFVTFFVLKQRK